MINFEKSGERVDRTRFHVLILSIIFIVLSVVTGLKVILTGCDLVAKATRPAVCRSSYEGTADISKAFEKYGMLIEMRMDKNMYAQGEEVHIQILINNTSGKAHDIKMGYAVGFKERNCYASSMVSLNGGELQWIKNSYGPKSFRIEGQQKMKIIDVVWDQESFRGSAAKTGTYDVKISFPRVIVDGELLYDAICEINGKLEIR